MPDTQDIFQRETEAGWVIVTSEIPRLGGAFSDLPERLLSKMDISRPSVCVAAGELLTPDLDRIPGGHRNALGHTGEPLAS